MKRKQESTRQQERGNKTVPVVYAADDGKGTESVVHDVAENPLAKIPRELVAIIFSFLDEGDELILRTTSMWLRNLIQEINETYHSNLFSRLKPILIKDEPFELMGHTNAVTALALDADKHVLYSGSDDKSHTRIVLSLEALYSTCLSVSKVSAQIEPVCPFNSNASSFIRSGFSGLNRSL